MGGTVSVSHTVQEAHTQVHSLTMCMFVCMYALYVNVHVHTYSTQMSCVHTHTYTCCTSRHLLTKQGLVQRAQLQLEDNNGKVSSGLVPWPQLTITVQY